MYLKVFTFKKNCKCVGGREEESGEWTLIVWVKVHFRDSRGGVDCELPNTALVFPCSFQRRFQLGVSLLSQHTVLGVLLSSAFCWFTLVTYCIRIDIDTDDQVLLTQHVQ